jgi:hypothetical protein
MEISWSFTPLVKHIPDKIDISLASTLQSTKNFNIIVARDLDVGGVNSTLWRVSALNDGSYMLRISEAKKDLLFDSKACLKDGEAVGANSPAFKVVNPVEMPPISPDRFGPNKNNYDQNLSSCIFIILCLILI